jgi:Zn-dependent M28 family amino/carboxypeptidase
MFQGQNRELNVSGTNYLAVFQGKNTSADVPLIILANYDTGDTEDNVVDDNGSGVVALIALAEHVSQQIVKGKLDLERTLIFALTDMAIGKYV